MASFFEGLTKAEFDAFDAHKWTSNVYNLERLEAKLKLIAVGKTIWTYLSKKLSDHEMEVTHERPSIFNQHQVKELILFFYRDIKARQSLGPILDKTKKIADHILDPVSFHKHIFLGFRLHFTGAEAGLYLHRDAWVDWKNLVERCRLYGGVDRFQRLLSHLPESVRFAQGDWIGANALLARDIDVNTVIHGFDTQDLWTIFGKTFSRDDLVRAGDCLPEQVSNIFLALLPLLTFIEWRRENDFCDFISILKKHKEKAEHHFTTFEVGNKIRIVKGIASGRIGVVDSIEHKNMVKVRIGSLVISLKIDDITQF